MTPQLVEQANPFGGYRRPRYSYTHTSNDASREQLSTLIATLAHASADAGASVQEVAQSSILAGTPWASPEAPPAKLTKAAPHLKILEEARPSPTSPMVPSPPAMSSTTLRPYQRRALAWMIVLRQCGNQPVRQAGLEVLFTILAASTQRESAWCPRTRRLRLTHPNVLFPHRRRRTAPLTPR